MEPSAQDLAEISSEVQPSASIEAGIIATLGSNGHGSGPETGHDVDLRDILHALQAMRVGDFSVRLPGDWTGLAGKIADTFNEIVAANAADGASSSSMSARSSARRARPASACSSALSQRRLGRDGELGQHADRRPAVADHRGDPRDPRRGAGRPAADHAARRRRPAAEGRVPALGHDRQHDDRAARACSPPK